MDITSLVPDFNTVAELGKQIGVQMVADGLLIAGGAIAATFVIKRAANRHVSSEVPVQRTMYQLSGVLDEDGNEYFDQKIRPLGEDATVDVADLLPPDMRPYTRTLLKKVCAHVDKQAARGGKYSIMPLNYLEAVMKPRLGIKLNPFSNVPPFEEIQGLLTAKWYIAGGTVLKGPGTNGTPYDEDRRLIPEVREHVNVLIYEPAHVARSEVKVLQFPRAQLESDTPLPPEHRVRYQTMVKGPKGNETIWLTNKQYKKMFQTQEDHPHRQRWFTNNEIAGDYKKGKWHLFPAEVETGRLVEVPPAKRQAKPVAAVF